MVPSCPICPECHPAVVMAERTGAHVYDFQGRCVTVDGIEFCECPECGRQDTHAGMDERNRERISIRHLELIAERWSRPPGED